MHGIKRRLCSTTKCYRRREGARVSRSRDEGGGIQVQGFACVDEEARALFAVAGLQ